MDENQNDMAIEDITAPTQTEGSGDASAMNTDAGQVESHTNADLEAQRENSRLGRKVAKLEGTIASMVELQNDLRSFLRQGQVSQNQLPDLPEYPTTRNDVEAIVEYKQRQQQQEMDKLTQKQQDDQRRYQLEYKAQLADFAATEPLHQEIHKEMMTYFNWKNTNSGSIDAMTNYQEAKQSLLAKKNASPRGANVRSESGVSTALGVSGQSAQTTPKAPVKLDPIAERFAKHMGMTDDQIRNALR